MSEMSPEKMKTSQEVKRTNANALPNLNTPRFHLNILVADTIIQIIFFPKGFAITFKWNFWNKHIKVF